MKYRIKRSGQLVMNEYLDQPRSFPTRKAAEEWGRLSQYGSFQIDAYS